VLVNVDLGEISHRVGLVNGLLAFDLDEVRRFVEPVDDLCRAGREIEVDLVVSVAVCTSIVCHLLS